MRAGGAKVSNNEPIDPLLLETTGHQPTLATDSVPIATLPSQGASFNTKPLFKLMVEKKASDLFFTPNAPIKIKIEGSDRSHQ